MVIPAKYIGDVLSAALEKEVSEPLPKNYALPSVEHATDGASEPLIAREKK